MPWLQCALEPHRPLLQQSSALSTGSQLHSMPRAAPFLLVLGVVAAGLIIGKEIDPCSCSFVKTKNKPLFVFVLVLACAQEHAWHQTAANA